MSIEFPDGSTIELLTPDLVPDVFELLTPDLETPDVVEVIGAGPQGIPGPQGPAQIWVGPTPPTDPTQYPLWLDTSS